jgi:dolichol-phosphate mannosyltransferase
LIAVASNFVLNNIKQHRDQALHGWQAVRGLIVFYLICAFGIFGNIGVASWVITTDKAWTLAGLTGAIMSAVWNYVVSAAFVWGRR